MDLLRWLCAALLLLGACAYQDSGVRRASFWPLLPRSHTEGSQDIAINPSTFRLSDVTGKLNSSIPLAISIYQGIIFPKSKVQRHLRSPDHAATEYEFAGLDIWAADPFATPPQPEIDESFTLIIPTPGTSSFTARLQASTYVGVLRGLETFSQMVVFGLINGSNTPLFHIPNAPWNIHEQPRFPHRGLLLDPARTFLPIPTLKTMVDGLLFSKMNVLHLHMVDSQSFPIQLASYPNITYYGAYSADEVYSAEDLHDLVSYAAKRGVRVIPEVESSSHSRTFGLAPELRQLVACADVPGSQWPKFCAEPPCGQINPAEPTAVSVVSTVLAEIAGLFPDVDMHLGFDEINQNCWLSDARFQQYIASHNFTVGQALQKYYNDIRSAMQQLTPGKQFVFWEEVALQNPPLALNPTDTVQVWNDIQALNKVFSNTPAKVLISWVADVYLDCGLTNIFGDPTWCQPFNTWLSIFQKDPLANITNPDYIARVKGGETCQWGETAGPASIMGMVWPRTAAYGARLWNYDISSYTSREVVLSMSDHAQRLIERGVPASQVTVPLCWISPELCFDPK